MKLFKYTYDDGKIFFEGYTKCQNSVNRVLLVTKEGFTENFHRFYPTVPMKNIDIHLDCISLKEIVSREDMFQEGFFVLISNECFDLCEMDEPKHITVLRSFETRRTALKFAKKNGYPVIEEF